MNVSVLILAGQREGVTDPLCVAAKVAKKAVIPINGRPMINYVLDALDDAQLRTPYHVSGFEASYDERLVQSPSGAGPADSAATALESGIDFPCIMTTADHPLLTGQMVEHFVQFSQASNADFCVGFAEKRIIHPAYPNVKRTYLKFSNRSVSGCNLFYLKNENGLKAIEFWKQAQHLRKQPLKLARRLGWGVLFNYITGRLSLDGAFDYASKRLNIKASPVLIPIAEAAIDVDKPSDKILVEAILAGTYKAESTA